VVVGQQKDLQVLVKLVGGLVVEALDGGFLNDAVLAAFIGLHFGKINVQVTDGIVVESLLRRALSVLAQGQPADAVALKTAVPGWAGETRNGAFRA
jgi:hypothetical protein